MIDHKQYTYRVTWSSEDNEHVALCAEFPSLSYLAEEPQEALSGLMDTVKEVIEDMASNGEEIPVPYALREYSGKLILRTTPEQHRNLAIQAAEQSISLNKHICSKLI